MTDERDFNAFSVAVWADGFWCYSFEIEEYIYSSPARSDDYVVRLIYAFSDVDDIDACIDAVLGAADGNI